MAWLVQSPLKQERIRQHSKQSRERIEGFCHAGLEIGGGGLWPDEIADKVGGESAA